MDTKALKWHVSANFQRLSFLAWYLAQVLENLKVSITWSGQNLHMKKLDYRIPPPATAPAPPHPVQGSEQTL